MDARTAKVYQALDSFMEVNGASLPDELKEQLTRTKDMLSAPLYSPESPGEEAARQVSEANMPDELSEEYYKDNPDVNVGVFGKVSETTLS